MLDEPDLLPPFGLRQLVRHARRIGEYARVLPFVGRPLGSLIDKLGLTDFEPLRVYLDAISQITVQCPAREAEALFALGTMDNFLRGTGHVSYWAVEPATHTKTFSSRLRRTTSKICESFEPD